MAFTRFPILGVNVSRVYPAQAIRLFLRYLESGQKGYVCFAGAQNIVDAQRDPNLRDALNGAIMTAPEGKPAVWLGQFAFGYRELSRVEGQDVMLQMFEATEGKEVRHFFCGGRPGVAEALMQRMQDRFPGAHFVGTYSPPLRRELNSEEEVEMLKEIADARPDVVWVGLGSPKQDVFMAQYLERMPATLLFGVGSTTFDTQSGMAPESPRWMRQIGLDWLFHVVQEPGRLANLHLRCNPQFFWLVMGQWFFGQGKVAAKNT